MSVLRRNPVVGMAFVLLLLISLTGCDGLFEAILNLGDRPAEPPVSSFIVNPPSGAAAGDMIILNGSGSSDPQGSTLAYQWSLAGPAGSVASLYPDYGPLVSFQADMPGAYTVVLTVTAGSKSSTASKSITVLEAASGNVDPSVDPIIGKWKLATMNAEAAADIPMAMNLTLSSDAKWLAIGSQPGEPMVTYGTWSSLSLGNYSMTFAFGGPDGVKEMDLVLDGSTLTGTFTAADGPETLVFIPGTAFLPDPIIGPWYLYSVNPQPSTAQAMNFAFNADKTWSMSGVDATRSTSAAGTWNQDSPGKYTIDYASGGPGVSSILFALSSGTLTGKYTIGQTQTTMVLHSGTKVLPVAINPLPAVFQTGTGNFSQNFKARAWRPGPAADADPWAPYTYMSFAISANGTRYTEYLNDVTGNVGSLNWYMSGVVQKLDFLDSQLDALYSFTVLHHSANYLHLRMLYGSEVREWIFSAGTGNLCGLVVDTIGQTLLDNSWYSKPLSGISIQLGTNTGTFAPIDGVTATTDEMGFFAFPDLVAPDGQVLGVKVTRAGYTDKVIGDPKTPPVSPSSTVFLDISL